MSLAFVIESFKFYRLKSRNFVQLLFVILILINFLALAFPPGDKDFSRVIQYFFALTNQIAILPTASHLLPTIDTESLLSVGNIVYLVFRYGIQVINILIALLYASSMNAAFDDYPNEDGIRSYFTKIPHIILFSLLLLVPYVISLLFFGIPFIILLSILAFTPMLLIERKMGMSEAMQESMHATSGLRIQMVVSFIVLNFLLSIPSNLLQTMFSANIISAAILSAFFVAIQVLSIGRLYTLYYLYYTRHYSKRRLNRLYSPEDTIHFFKEVNRQFHEEFGDPDDSSDDTDEDDE